MAEIKRIIRYGKELERLDGKKWVIWGAGFIGRHLLREVRIHNIRNVYIYDTNSAKTKDLKEKYLWKK